LLLLACGAWPQAALAHGEEIIIYVFGTIVAAGALFGLVGGLVCVRDVARLCPHLRRIVSAAALMEVVSIVLLVGGMLGAVALGIAYAVAHYLKRNAKSWS
jgi:hypothetical protein